jgi:hypothetical protein
MRHPAWFLAIPLLFPIALFSQRPSSPSSGPSSDRGSYSPPADRGSYSPPSSPSYSPPSSSSSSGNSSSGSSSSDRGSYNPPSRGNTQQPTPRNSNNGSSGSQNDRSGSDNRSSTRSGANIRDFNRNHPSSQREGSAIPGDSAESNRTDMRRMMNQMNLRQTDSRLTGVSPARIVAVPPTSNAVVDPGVQHKYASKVSSLMEKQGKLDRESAKLFSKYKLGGSAQEFNRKQAKLDAKRAKLIDAQNKLASSYQADAELKRCKGKDCFPLCPPGTAPGHRGCVATSTPPPQNSQTAYDYNEGCGIGFVWNGRRCIDSAQASPPPPPECSEYYSALMPQKRMRDSIKDSQRLACTANSVGQECKSLTAQLNAADAQYRELERQYNLCRLRP